MPFYFAIPRKGITAPQRRRETDRTDYVRTSPTDLSYVSYTSISRLQAFAVEALHAVYSSAMAGFTSKVFDKSFRVDTPSSPVWQAVALGEAIPVEMPNVTIKFDGDPSQQVKDLLVDEGFDERTIKGKGLIFDGKVTDRVKEELANTAIETGFTPLGGSISVQTMGFFSYIRQMITCVAQALDIACDNRAGENMSIAFVEYGATEKRSLSSHKVSDLSEISAKKELSTIKVIAKDVITEVVALRAPNPIFGDSIDTVRGYLGHGLFCPFEPNYSGTDRRAFHNFVAAFSSVLLPRNDPQGLNAIGDAWTDEICMTMEGEFLAHMMACLILCKKTQSQPYFIVSNGLYEGCVVHGSTEFSITLLGGDTFSSIDSNGLKEEFNRYAFHSVTLRKVCTSAGLPEDEDLSEITTMRKLRDVVYGRNGFAFPLSVKTSIEKNLGFLNFREKPVSVNLSSIRDFLSYIDRSNPVVPRNSVFMDRAAFFETDPHILALAMFGRFAPSPISHGTSYTVAVAPSSTQKVSNEPANIQFVFKDLRVAAKDWSDFLRGGSIVYPISKVKRSRVFRGAEKTALWGMLKDVAANAMIARKGEVAASREISAGKRKDRDDGPEGSNKKPKTTFGQISFSAFTPTAMQTD